MYSQSPPTRPGWTADRPLRPVVLTKVHRQLLAADPTQIPAHRPRFRVRARIVDRDLVVQRIEIRPREALRQAQQVRVRQPAVREPEILVESGRLDDERVAFPSAAAAAVVERVVVVAADLAAILAAVEVDDSIVVV